MRFGLTLSAVVCFAPAGAALADDAPKLEIAAGAAVRFASVEEGRTVLQSDDAFTRSLSPFDLQSRMKSAEKVQLEAWKDFVAQHVRPWEEEDVKAVTESVTRLSKRLAKYRLPLPKEIVLVRTSGEEEGNAAYTRGTAIVLPDKVLKYSPQQLDRLLTHELLHILSRHDGALRQRLYRIVGFEVCDPIAMPESLAPRKITNPDAPLVDCVIELTADDGQTYTAAPVLYATQDYDAARGGTLFQYLTFRLLVVEKKGNRWQPRLLKGEPIVIDAKKEPAYLEKIGQNTNYIIHPDEILADNFVHLVMDDADLMTPRIIEQMKRALAP